MLLMFQRLRMSNCDTTTFHTNPPLSSHSQLLRRKGTIPAQILLLGILFCALVLTGCGPESSASSQEELAATTGKIALAYQSHRNLTQASAELEKLEVANLNQWVLYVTETAVTNNTDPNQTDALVVLATDMGLQSNPIREYAVQHNLLAAAVALQPEVKVEPQVQAQPVAAAPQAQVETAPKEPAVQSAKLVTETSTMVSTTTVLTDTSAVTAAAILTPTATAEPATATPTPDAGPQVIASSAINVRSGPGTDYGLAGALQQNEIAAITGKNTNGDWWEVTLANGLTGWVYGALVQTTGDTNVVAVAANIPLPPPTATPAPTQPPAAPTTPAEAPAATAAPEATQAPAADPNGAPQFTLVSKRLWGKAENDGCIGKHLLRIHVLDANGTPLNGIRLKGIYTGQEMVTGDQGKGDGVIEYDLYNSGEGFTVIRNNDGREAGSDRAEGFTTRSVDIDQATLIAAGYCSNDTDCQIFYSSWGCQGHHSWEAIFKRNY